MLRCPLCANFSYAPLASGLLRCNLCALAFPADGRAVLRSIETYRVGNHDHLFSNWNNWVFRSTGLGLRAGPHGDRIYFSPTAVRIYAAKQGLLVTSVRTNLPFTRIFLPSWRFGGAIEAEVAQPIGPKPGADRRLTLGVITTPEAWSEVVELCRDMAGLASDVVIMLDTDDSRLASDKQALLRAALDGGVYPMQGRVLAHRLNGDFAAQRNRIQEAVSTEWVIQLDSDERLALPAKRFLPVIIDDAQRNGWSAVALPRRNLVDGVFSALYPDIQCRLVRNDIRFVRPVHEYPDLTGKASFVFLSAEILHHINSSRLRLRETLYEGIQKEAGRPHDTALLQTPIEPGVWVPATDIASSTIFAA